MTRNDQDGDNAGLTPNDALGDVHATRHLDALVAGADDPANYLPGADIRRSVCINCGERVEQTVTPPELSFGWIHEVGYYTCGIEPYRADLDDDNNILFAEAAIETEPADVDL